MRRVRTKMKDPTFVLTFVSALGCGLWPESSRIFELRHEGSGWRASHSRNCRPNCGTVIEAEEEVETLVEVFLRLGTGGGDGVMQVPMPGRSSIGFAAEDA